MYKNRFVIVLVLLFRITGIYSQEFSYRAPVSYDTIIPSKDTIKLYLGDTSFYIFDDDMKYYDNKTGYFRYFSSTGVFWFELRDSLPDGFYCLYNITKKQSRKMKNYEKYFVASGEFKDGMKQGEFIFYDFTECSDGFVSKDIKIIHFKNDTVHGKVVEEVNGKIEYFGEYNMGVKDGFFYHWLGTIILYKDGEIVKETDIYSK